MALDIFRLAVETPSARRQEDEKPNYSAMGLSFH